MRLRVLCTILFATLLACKSQSDKKSVSLPSEEERFSFYLDSLKKQNVPDYEIVNYIRKYVSVRMDGGSSRDALAENYYKIPYDSFSGFRCLELFQKDSLAGKCGLISFVLADLYSFAGYENYIYNCGYSDIEGSHEFNLVKVDDKLIVQDAFMDMTITNADGSPKDFLQALAEIKTDDYSNYRVQSDTVVSEMWFDSVSVNFFQTFCASQPYLQQVKEMKIIDNRLRLLLSRNYDFLSGWTLNVARDLLIKDGLPPRFPSLYLKPIGILDGKTGEYNEELLNSIKAITNSGSPN